MGQVNIAYYKTTMGVTQQQTGTSANYYGKVFRIPKDLFSEEGDVDFEKDVGELVQEVQSKGLEPMIEGTTVERYEIWDVENGDVLVMYRIPCKSKETE
jgi:hypothetical protein